MPSMTDSDPPRHIESPAFEWVIGRDERLNGFHPLHELSIIHRRIDVIESCFRRIHWSFIKDVRLSRGRWIRQTLCA